MAIEWRFVVECISCAELIDLGPAPTLEEQEPATHAGLEIDCPHCGAAQTYQAGQVKRAAIDTEA